MKKMFCAFLAIAMCMALALPAFADDDIVSGTDYTGSVQTPTIKVTAPTSAAVILNPYLISITKASVVSGGSGNFQPSVVTPTLVLKNQSNVPLKMTLTVTGEIPQGSTAKFLTAAPAATEKNHGVFMYVDVLNKGSLATAPTAAQVLSDGVTAYADANVYSATNTSGTQCVVKAGAVKMTDFMTLAVPAANQAGYVTIDIGGECATTPTDAWAATDTVNVALAFTFTSTSNTVSGA